MRDRNKLRPEVLLKLEHLEKLAEENNINFIVTQTLRSQEEQAAYYAQGRLPLEVTNELRLKAKLGPLTNKENHRFVTKAKTVWDSFHAYGLAFDVAICDTYGKISWDTEGDWNSDGISDWVNLGNLGESIGLEWGGNWSSFRDLPHFQYRMGNTIASLRVKNEKNIL